MAPPSKPDPLPALTTESKAELRALSRLVHRLYHRNKNQHRRSLWWRHFDAFRRELRRMAAETAAPDVKFEHGVDMKRRRRAAARKKQIALARWQVWRGAMVGKWFSAFSQLLSTLRFPSLALVLIASLARICHLLGITSAIQAIAAEEAAKAASRWATEDVEQISALAEAEHAGGETDLGTIIPRESEPVEFMSIAEEKRIVVETDDTSTEHATVTTTAKVTAEKDIRAKKESMAKKDGTSKRELTAKKEITAKRSKTKRKKRDAIDELFSGL